MLKKGIIFSLIFALLMSNSYAIKAFADYEAICNEKITEELSEQMKEVKNDDEISVLIWFDDSELNVSKSDIISEVYASRNVKTEDDLLNLSVDDRFEIVHEIRALTKSKMQEKCSLYIKNCIKDIDKFGTIEYYDDLSPMICSNVCKSNIKNISKISNVEKIYYCNDFDVKELLDTSRKVIAANTVQTNGIFGQTGSGVNIGMIDVGIPNTSITS